MNNIIKKMMRLTKEKGIIYRRLLSFLVTYIDDQAKQARDEYVDDSDIYIDDIQWEQHEGLVTRKLRCYDKKEILLSLAKDKVIKQDINIFTRDNVWLLHLVDLGFSTHHILIERCNEYNRRDVRKKWREKEGVDTVALDYNILGCVGAIHIIAESFPYPIESFTDSHAIYNKSKKLEYNQELEEYINWLTKEIKKGNIRLLD